MPRSPRIEIPGGIHHVTGKSPSGRLLFLTDAERRMYLALLAHEILERGWDLFTYCLMTNHLHFVVRTPEPDLGMGIKAAHEAFARYINRTRGEGGHLFGARFKNKPVLTDSHLLACFRYVARNPVDAQMCRRPEDYAWSADRALRGLTEPPRFLDIDQALSPFGGPTTAASRRTYQRFVARSDEHVLSDLITPGDDSWLITARDEFDIPLERIQQFLGIGRTRLYERLATARQADSGA